MQNCSFEQIVLWNAKIFWELHVLVGFSMHAVSRFGPDQKEMEKAMV